MSFELFLGIKLTATNATYEEAHAFQPPMMCFLNSSRIATSSQSKISQTWEFSSYLLKSRCTKGRFVHFPEWQISIGHRQSGMQEEAARQNGQESLRYTFDPRYHFSFRLLIAKNEIAISSEVGLIVETSLPRHRFVLWCYFLFSCLAQPSLRMDARSWNQVHSLRRLLHDELLNIVYDSDLQNERSNSEGKLFANQITSR